MIEVNIFFAIDSLEAICPNNGIFSNPTFELCINLLINMSNINYSVTSNLITSMQVVHLKTLDALLIARNAFIVS